ncbi:endonuclease exonuclease phosphatase family protein [Saccharata proteae CBS 121410]|uniref:Endonuclease exonuclease phosphatase family protein n=1 Tax=Saccharata proteae CBS 121410 TaxID=1314787 RepID=A0A9P4I2K9_9PEZI|nr:endonuclease exonuclease phosphatase family protein [Saccharata proteae CBS 121410]
MAPTHLALLALAIPAAVRAASASTGTFNILSFNVAGLPAILNNNDESGDKTENTEIIGTDFADYGFDLIHVQEDFNYHATLYEYDNHTYRTSTSGGAGIGSGLNSLSNYDWIDFTRVKWDTCSDASEYDCLTPKGFTFMRWTLDDGIYIDAYNLHADAGTEDGDETARTANIQQVADYIDTWSTGNAVLVFGDTNSRYTRTADNIALFTTQNNLTDAWVELELSGTPPTVEDVCSNPAQSLTCEVVDKVFYRPSTFFDLSATSFAYDAAQFLSANNSVLSDHNPLLVSFSWTPSTSLRQSAFSGGPHGAWFNDAVNISTATASPLAAVLTLSGGNRLDSVAMTLTDGTTLSHGGTGGTPVDLTLAADEYINAATMCTGEYDGHTRNFYINVTTSAGNTAEAGTATDDCTAFTAESGWGVVGFLGQSGDEMDQLALVYAPVA